MAAGVRVPHMPRRDFPRDLRDLPESAAREVYIHRAVGRGLAHVFFKEHEAIQGAAHGSEVSFRFVDIVYFFAVAAAQGIVGNLTYAALMAAIRAVREPGQEIGSGGLRFEAVVSRRTYNRVRRQTHGSAKASRASS